MEKTRKLMKKFIIISKSHKKTLNFYDFSIKKIIKRKNAKYI